MNSKKIEIDILLFFLIEAIFLLLFFKENILTNLLGIILGIFLIILTKNISKNKYTMIVLLIITIPFSYIILIKSIAFINNNILKDYSPITIIVPFLITAIYLVIKKYHAFIKTVEISFYFLIIIKIISFILIVSKININYLSFSNLSINHNFFLIGFVLLYLYKTVNYLTNYHFNKKRFIISSINPLFMQILSISILGKTLFSIYQYPYVNYLKNIHYFDFIERVDGILSFEYLFCFFYLFVYLLLNIKLLSKQIINN